MKIDIATKVLGPEDDVYIVRPGEGYWAYELMERSSRIFLDFPDLRVNPKGQLPADDTLRLHIARSIALREWHDDEQPGPRPSDDPNDFDDQAYRRRLGRYVGAVKRLISDLSIGTVIVVPDEGYFGQVLVGEVVGRPEIHAWKQAYDGEPLITRRVKWSRSKLRGSFDEEIRDLLGHTTPVLQLPRSLREEILYAGFDQFAYENSFSARLNTEEEDFSTLDDYSIQSFLNYVTGILIASEQGVTEKVSYSDAIGYVQANPERAMELQQNINSPGFQRLIDSTVAPLAAAVLLTAAVSSSSPQEILTNPTEVEVVNSKGVNDDCTIEVVTRVSNARDLMLIDDWEKQCKQMKAVRENTGISTSMKIDDGDS